MKRFGILSACLLSLVLSAPVDAQERSGKYRHQDNRQLGRVVDVQPIWPRQRCRPEVRRETGNRDRARLTGALAGGALGHLIGRERDHALLGTLAGAMIGAAGAEVIVSAGQRRAQAGCARGPDLKYHSPIAYQVRYRYRGRLYTTRTRTHPGRYIELNSGHHRRG